MSDERPAESSRKVPSVIGGYRVLKRLSRGGMGEVWLGAKESAGGFEKRVAIKVVLPGYDDREDYRTLFFDEARLVARMAHANLTQVFDFGEDQGVLFLVMEFVDGISLERLFEELRKTDARVPPELAGLMVAQVARGLHHAHTLVDDDGRPLAVVHRDVSPQNLILTWSGQMKVIDFGIARSAVRQNVTQMGIVRGKPGYMAPEQAKGRTLDARTDVFQLGIVLYELLCGEHLYLRPNLYASIAAAVEEPLPDVMAKIPGLERGFVDVLGAALAKDPDDRFRTADAMARALDQVVARSGRVVTEAALSDFARPFRAPTKEVPSSPPAGRETGARTLPVDTAAAAGRPEGVATVPAVRRATPPPAPLVEVTPSVRVARVEAPTTAAAIAASRGRGLPVGAWIALVALLVVVGAGALLLTRADGPGDDDVGGDDVVVGDDGVGGDEVARPALVVDDGDAAEAPDAGALAMPDADEPPDADDPPRPPPSPSRPRTKPRVVERAPASSDAPKPSPAAEEPTPAEVKPVEEKPAVVGRGTLTVVAEPYGEVILDGKPLGATPIIARKIPAGPHTVEIVAPDTRAVRARESFVLEDGASRRVSAR